MEYNRKKKKRCWPKLINDNPKTPQAPHATSLNSIPAPPRVEVRVEEIENSEDYSEQEPLIIDSLFKASDVKYVDEFPDNEKDRKIYKFNWPIWLRYFNECLILKLIYQLFKYYSKIIKLNITKLVNK